MAIIADGGAIKKNMDQYEMHYKKKTPLFEYIENSTSQNLKFSDKKI